MCREDELNMSREDKLNIGGEDELNMSREDKLHMSREDNMRRNKINSNCFQFFIPIISFQSRVTQPCSDFRLGLANDIQLFKLIHRI